MERTTNQMEKLNEEYSDTNQHFQECLDALREENGSYYSRSSIKNRQLVKSIESQRSKKREEVKQQMADFEKKVIEKEQRSLEQEYLSKQKILEKKLEEVENSTKNYINMEAEDYQHSKRSTKDDDISWWWNQNQEEGEEEEREDEEGLHADDTNELLSRRNLIVRWIIDEEERKKEDNERTNNGKKEVNEKNNKGKKGEKKEKTNWDKMKLGQGCGCNLKEWAYLYSVLIRNHIKIWKLPS